MKRLIPPPANISLNDFEREFLSANTPFERRNAYKRNVAGLVEKGIAEDEARSIVLDNLVYISDGKKITFYKRLIEVIPELEVYKRAHKYDVNSCLRWKTREHLS